MKRGLPLRTGRANPVRRARLGMGPIGARLMLVALAAGYQVMAARLKQNRVGHQVLTGLLFGGAGLVLFGLFPGGNASPTLIRHLKETTHAR